MTTCLSDLRGLARALDGEVAGGQVLAPGPGHSLEDRSLSVRLSPDARDGFIVHSFSGDDPIACRDHVRARLGLRAFSPQAAKAGRGEKVSRHVYQHADGTPYLLVPKFIDANGKKQYPQAHWDGAQWTNGKPKGEKIPYRLPELLAAPPSARLSDDLVELGRTDPEARVISINGGSLCAPR
jgi:hypothetical protein